MGQQDAFRVGCRTRGVGDIGVVVRANALVARFELVTMFLQELITHLLDFADTYLAFLQFHALVEHNHLLHQRALADNLANLGQLILADHHVLGIGVLHTELQVNRLQFLRQGHVYAASIQDAQFTEHPHISGLRKQRHAFAFLQPQSHQSRAQTISLQAGCLKTGLYPLVSYFLTKIGLFSPLASVILNKINNCYSFRHIFICLVRIP